MKFLITSKVSGVRRRIVDPVSCAGGATTEAYFIIRRKEKRAKATPLELSEIPSWREDDILLVIRGILLCFSCGR